MHAVIKTEDNCIFWGELADGCSLTSEVITLTGARQCIYFAPETRGLAGLAHSGPSQGSRVGPVVASVVLRRPDIVLEASSAARERWLAAGWES